MRATPTPIACCAKESFLDLFFFAPKSSPAQSWRDHPQKQGQLALTSVRYSSVRGVRTTVVLFTCCVGLGAYAFASQPTLANVGNFITRPDSQLKFHNGDEKCERKIELT